MIALSVPLRISVLSAWYFNGNDSALPPTSGCQIIRWLPFPRRTWITKRGSCSRNRWTTSRYFLGRDTGPSYVSLGSRQLDCAERPILGLGRGWTQGGQ